MIARYTTKEMENNWLEKTKFVNWVEVETAVLRAKVEIGELQVEVPENCVM